MSPQVIVGSDLIELASDKLAGYANAVDSRALLSYLNEGKDAIWEILKANNDDFFTKFSQSTTPGDDDYFPPLTTAVREYDLPEDFKEIRFIECTTSGFETAQFVFRKPSDPDYRAVRQGATAGGPSANTNICEFLYTIISNQLVLANYPQDNLTITLWYTQSIPDFEFSDPLPSVLFPYSKSIATYACKLVLLGQDDSKFAAWKSEWKDAVISASQNSAPRNQADPCFVEDFFG